MADYYFLVSALLLGLFSAPHCIGMCGGIAGALALNSSGEERPSPAWMGLLVQNAGRVASYALLGALAGQIGFSLTSAAPMLVPFFRLLAGALMVAMGLYIGGWWSGLKRLENAGFAVWQKIVQAVPSLGLSRNRRLASGLLWGFLPCGLVYTMLTSAMATGNALDGALLMLCFGVGTLPTLIAAGLLAERAMRWRELRGLREFMGGSVILFGAWTAGFVVWMVAAR